MSDCTRRALLHRAKNGLGMIALAGLLCPSNFLSAGIPPPSPALTVKAPHFPAKAKRVIMLFLHGGMSQVDSFDPKPLLTRDHGKPFSGNKPRIKLRPDGLLLRSPWTFARHGQSGIEVSELFPHLASRVDDLCVIRSMVTDNTQHQPATVQLHTGSDTFIRPSMGAWLGYGLGSENQDLPGFITICPPNGVQNWGSAFLPADYQGTPIGENGGKPRDATIPNLSNLAVSRAQQRDQLDLLAALDRTRTVTSTADKALASRINSFELAYRMQTKAPEALDISRESAETLALYGIGQGESDSFGRQCLLACRLAERGVRFTECCTGYLWDQHNRLTPTFSSNARAVDKPIAGLIADLKRRGLLDDTLVWVATEFGRTPTSEEPDGRDHNPHGYTMLLAGGGTKAGYVHGATDDYGYYAVHDKVHLHDLHATVLHLLGLDHERLTFRHAGRDFRLTDVAGDVVRQIIA